MHSFVRLYLNSVPSSFYSVFLLLLLLWLFVVFCLTSKKKRIEKFHMEIKELSVFLFHYIHNIHYTTPQTFIHTYIYVSVSLIFTYSFLFSVSFLIYRYFCVRKALTTTHIWKLFQYAFENWNEWLPIDRCICVTFWSTIECTHGIPDVIRSDYASKKFACNKSYWEFNMHASILLATSLLQKSEKIQPNFS